MALRYIGKGTTDSTGVAHLTTNASGETVSPPGYVGVGAGKLDIVASVDKPIGSSSVVSQPCTVFDCPVYDGDNTPTSISWSKTNNAVVTDEVVSLIASVLNTNNNPCINIPVVFKQGDTVLGTAYTDVYGDATITYTWADSDIFNISAQIGQSLSEDLTMFVKDKNNLFSFNLWACGDYSNTLGFNSNGGTGYISTVKSNEWSSLGEYSAKVTMKNNALGYVRFGLTELSELLGKTIRFSCDIKTDYPLRVSIYALINGNYATAGSVNVPVNSEGSFEVSYLVNNNVTKLLFSIDHYADTLTSDNITFYTDTWSLTVLDE